MKDGDPAFEHLLDYLYQSHGFDFTGYKRTSLMRRVQRRFDELRLDGAGEYLDYLQVHPEEFAVLFDTILINVTAFFRDPAAWEFLRDTVIPRILAARPDESLIRVWGPGCASGEEAYTLAMVFAEALGVEAFRRRVKIYATDVDEDALARARNGSYAVKSLDGVPDDLREKYFEVHGQRATFDPDMRRSVIFGRHDLVQDAPISRLDLLVSRNTMMYFTAETQRRILARLHYALNDDGYLFLGRAEMLLTHGNLFAPLDLRHRVFVKVAPTNLRERLLVLADVPDREPGSDAEREWRLREAALDTGPVAQLTLDAAGVLLMANTEARRLLGLGGKDMGRRLQDLEVSYRPLELRSRIEQAQSERGPVTEPDVERQLDDGRVQSLEVVVTPLFDDDGSYLGATVAFVDTTAVHTLRSDLQRHKQELETAYEELQSTNGELQTINGEMRARTVELDRLNAFMESVLTSLRAALVVVDTEMRVQIWNGHAEELWGLRADEVVGRSLLTLDIGLPVERLTMPLRRAVTGEDGGEDLTLSAHNRRGRTITCRVTFTPLVERSAPQGAVVLMEEIAAVATN